MLELSTTLTAVHFLYLIGVIVILSVMVMRRDTPMICIVFLFLLGLAATGTLAGAIQTVFSSALYAAKEFMEIIATIALITALSKCLSELGSDYLMMKPMSKVMCTPSVTWWILGGVMLLFSLFLWPSPSVALVGAIMLPLAIHKGLTPWQPPWPSTCLVTESASATTSSSREPLPFPPPLQALTLRIFLPRALPCLLPWGPQPSLRRFC